MRPVAILGILLIVLGVGAALFGHFNYSQTKPVIDAGPLHVSSQEDHTVWIPTLAAIAVIAAGSVLVFAGMRKS